MMAGTWPKVIQDPVHGMILLEDNPTDRLLLELINTREFQRLRRIKQLGMTELVFPGGIHNRFLHSIGVMDVARRMLDRVSRLLETPLSEEHRLLILVAALLHDLGHGPFSHTFEKVTGEDHEKRTIEIITSPVTEVNERLRDHNSSLPQQLKTFFGEGGADTTSDAGILHVLRGIVSSQLDADRCDYLLRDSMFTGVAYGQFELPWLIGHLYVDLDKDRLYLSHKAISTIEQYAFARHHMYRSVYYHKTTRAAEVMLRLLFKRLRALVVEGGNGEELLPEAPTVVIQAVGRERMTISQYLSLDDHIVSSFMAACSRSSDRILSDIAKGLLNRKLFKAIEMTGASAPAVAAFYHEAVKRLEQLGLDPNYSFESDTPADMPYKPYDPADDDPATQIYVKDPLGKIREISMISGPVEQLKKRYQLVRYYFPEKVREEMEGIWSKHVS